MSEQTFEGWCILELMGHRKLAGLVAQQEIAGAAFLRIDVPAELHAAAQRERNLRFRSLWKPFLPFPPPQREVDSTGCLADDRLRVQHQLAL